MNNYHSAENPQVPDENDEEKVDWAIRCGLSWTGYDEDGLTFIGTDEQFKEYWDGLDRYDDHGDYEPAEAVEE